MAKTSKKAAKKAAKTSKKAVPAAAEPIEVAHAVEIIEDPAINEATVEEVVEQKDDNPPTTTPPEELKRENVNEEPVTPEVVEPKKEEKKEETMSISKGLSKIAEGDRLDHNHAVDLMKMIHTEYVGNPATPPELGKAMKHQFDAMAMVELMYYNAQVESDMQQLGVTINKEHFEEVERLAKNLFGMSLKALPSKANSNQLTINFSESVPQEAKDVAKKDVAVQKDDVPDPDPKLPTDIKLKSLRTIFSHVGGGIGNNLKKGIDWGRIAFGFKPEEKKAVTLANILQNDFKTTLTNGLLGMVSGKLNEDHSIIGAHALLHSWLPDYSDEEIAAIIQVCLSSKEENACKVFNDFQKRNKGKLLNNGQPTSIENCLTLINREIKVGFDNSIIDGILGNKEQVVVKYDDGVGSVAVNLTQMRKNLFHAYGNSESIIADKLRELPGYYVKPIMRLSSYIDGTAFSTALA